MPHRPTFAVVIPTYNRARRVVRTLESVFAQSEPATEIIVVDNHSTDDTVQVMTRLRENHPTLHFIRHDRNLERAASRNTGMEHATADYVTFLDSDDLMYPDNLRDAADFAEATGSKFFHNLYESVDEEGRHLRDWRVPSLRDPKRALALGNFLSCIGVFLHRDVYRECRFDTNPVVTGSEDWELWLRVAARHDIGRIPKVNSAIVQHEGRTMGHQDVDLIEERVEYILDKVYSDPDLSEAYAPYESLMRAGRKVFLGMASNDAATPRRTLGYLKEAALQHPPILAQPMFWRCFQLAVTDMIRP